MYTPRFFATLVLPMVLAWAGAADANLVQLVTVNTSGISGSAGYAIAFSFQDGSGLAPADNNNTATLSSFNFGGGSAVGLPDPPIGGASGSLGAGVVLADSDFSSLFVQGFTPGLSLSFILDLTTNLDSGTPDFFGFSILFNGTPLPTLDDLGGDNLLYVNIDSANPVAAVFATAPGSQVALAAPGLSPPPPPGPGPGQLPEPGSLPLLLAGLAGLFGVVRRRSLSAPS